MKAKNIRRRTVKAVVRDIRRDNPWATVEVLKESGWQHELDGTPLPEDDWGKYRVNEVRWYGDYLAVVKAS